MQTSLQGPTRRTPILSSLQRLKGGPQSTGPSNSELEAPFNELWNEPHQKRTTLFHTKFHTGAGVVAPQAKQHAEANMAAYQTLLSAMLSFEANMACAQAKQHAEADVESAQTLSSISNLDDVAASQARFLALLHTKANMDASKAWFQTLI